MTDLIDTGVPILEIAISPGTPNVVINTSQILTLPINCVLMGAQDPLRKAMPIEGMIGPLKGIFRE